MLSKQLHLKIDIRYFKNNLYNYYYKLAGPIKNTSIQYIFGRKAKPSTLKKQSEGLDIGPTNFCNYWAVTLTNTWSSS